jgi:hypothetical protein
MKPIYSKLRPPTSLGWLIWNQGPTAAARSLIPSVIIPDILINKNYATPVII